MKVSAITQRAIARQRLLRPSVRPIAAMVSGESVRPSRVMVSSCPTTLTARVAIEGDEAVQGACQQQRPARVQAAVAVTAAITAGQDGGADGNRWKLIGAASQRIHDV